MARGGGVSVGGRGAQARVADTEGRVATDGLEETEGGAEGRYTAMTYIHSSHRPA